MEMTQGIPPRQFVSHNARYESKTQGWEAAAERGNPSCGGFGMPWKKAT